MREREKEEEILSFESTNILWELPQLELRNTTIMTGNLKSTKHINIFKERAGNAITFEAWLSNKSGKYSCCNDLKYSAFVSNCKVRLTFIRKINRGL